MGSEIMEVQSAGGEVWEAEVPLEEKGEKTTI